MNPDFWRQAYSEVTYLHDKLEKENLDISQMEFEQLPLLEKDEILWDPLCLMPPGYLPLLYQNKLVQAHTSGSTGKCMEVYWKLDDCRRSLYPLWFYRRKFYGIHTWDKMCRFYTLSQPNREDEWKRQERYHIEFSKSNLTDERMLKIYDEMLEFQPVWLLLQPCIAELLCRVKTEYQLPRIESLKYIEMTGEMFTDRLRGRLKELFPCDIANQYGMNEVNSIAYECPEGNLHCMEENVLVEILDEKGNPVPEGEPGDIYVTTWHNRAMPFIRYGTGDRGIFLEKTCRCGHKGKVLSLLSGRKNDWILINEKEKANPFVFIRAVEAVNCLTDHCILQYQIIQKAYDKFIVNLVLEEFVEDIPQMFINNIGQKELKQASYEFRFQDALLPDETGKVRFFKRDM